MITKKKAKWHYQRVLLKLSGEALGGEGEKTRRTIDPVIINRVGQEIHDLVCEGAQIALVLGGGNIFRGTDLAKIGINRVTADHMGMLATLMNALAMKDVLQGLQCETRVMSSINISHLCEPFQADQAKSYLNEGKVVVFAAGTGNPLFTTDTAASLRGIEVDAELIIKATKVDGVYSADPVLHPEAIRYDRLTFEQVLQQDLKVMDTTAILLCRENKVPIRVFNMKKAGALRRLLNGDDIGTLVE